MPLSFPVSDSYARSAFLFSYCSLGHVSSHDPLSFRFVCRFSHTLSLFVLFGYCFLFCTILVFLVSELTQCHSSIYTCSRQSLGLLSFDISGYPPPFSAPSAVTVKSDLILQRTPSNRIRSPPLLPLIESTHTVALFEQNYRLSAEPLKRSLIGLVVGYPPEASQIARLELSSRRVVVTFALEV